MDTPRGSALTCVQSNAAKRTEVVAHMTLGDALLGSRFGHRCL